jgi:hypothetical protein
MKEILSLLAGLKEFVKLVLQISLNSFTRWVKVVHRQEARRRAGRIMGMQR